MIKIGSLKSLWVLKGLSDSEIEDVGRNLAPVSLEKGAYLFYRNDQSSGIYFLSRGSLQITIDNDENKEIIVYVIMQGDIVGEMSLFSHSERSATVVALEKCLLYKISPDKFLELMMLYPTIGVNLSRILIERLNEANAIIERLGTMDGPGRVSNFIKSLALRTGDFDEEFYRIRRKPTHRIISQRLGLSEKTVYRAMHDLLDNQTIEVRDGSLYVKKSFVEKRD
ncbi:MAG: Crp/Fnr family transcriptional regulator [Nitrospinota bacterium]|nr:Crp/Fnr family transcriptional regulator [Nitrospinota bacterium]MDH5677838.1 Crp/Fnr family transcriptional regulator [Nitrospinota bacterium]MDH5756427.1 Crp/Fnr family transcriptional regulator [Nitrospinota bacterium]